MKDKTKDLFAIIGATISVGGLLLPVGVGSFVALRYLFLGDIDNFFMMLSIIGVGLIVIVIGIIIMHCSAKKNPDVIV